jgi:dienelactone hydrolase
MTAAISDGPAAKSVHIALYHSVLGVRTGVLDAAQRLRNEGYGVTVVDQYDGRVFDDYARASAYAESVGYPHLMQIALDAVSSIAEPLVCAGFSNGGGMAQFVAANRPGVAGALLMSGVMDPAMIGITAWPPSVPAQVHYTRGDPFRNEEWLAAGVKAITDSGASLEQFDYEGSGHLFTDPSLPGEYDEHSAALLWQRAFTFLDRVTA